MITDYLILILWTLGKLDPKVLGANQCQYLLATKSTLKWLQQEMENEITEIVNSQNAFYQLDIIIMLVILLTTIIYRIIRMKTVYYFDSDVTW